MSISLHFYKAKSLTFSELPVITAYLCNGSITISREETNYQIMDHTRVRRHVSVPVEQIKELVEFLERDSEYICEYIGTGWYHGAAMRTEATMESGVVTLSEFNGTFNFGKTLSKTGNLEVKIDHLKDIITTFDECDDFWGASDGFLRKEAKWVS